MIIRPRLFALWLAVASLVSYPCIARGEALPAKASETLVPATDLPESDGVQTARIVLARPIGKITTNPDVQIEGPPRYALRPTAGVMGSVEFVPDRQLANETSVVGFPSGLPLAGLVTSGFGTRVHPTLGRWRFHTGIDLAADYGTPIRATENGVVSRTGWAGDYGILVDLDHGVGASTLYAHMQSVAVRPGQYVRKGEVIGYVGSTGNSTGPHVHYEVRQNGKAVDPLGG